MSLDNFVKRLSDIMRQDAGINGDAQRIEQLAWLLFLKVYDSMEQNYWQYDDSPSQDTDAQDGDSPTPYRSIIPEECQWRAWAHDDGSGRSLSGPELITFVDTQLFPRLKAIEVTPSTPQRQAIVRAAFEDANQYMKDGVLLRQVVNIIDAIDLSDYRQSHALGDIYETLLREIQSAGRSGEFYTPRALTDFMAEAIEPRLGERMADFACGTGGFLTSWLAQLDRKVHSADDRTKLQTSVYGVEKKQFPYMLCLTNLLLHQIDNPDVHHDNSLAVDVLDIKESQRFDVILMNPPYGSTEKADIKNHFPEDLRTSETADLFVALITYSLKRNGRAAVVLPNGFLFGTDRCKINLKKRLLEEFNLHTIVRLPQSVFAPYTSIATNILFFDHRPDPDAREGLATAYTWFYRLDMPQGLKSFKKKLPMTSAHLDPLRQWWSHREELTDPEGGDKARRFEAEELRALDYNFDQCKFPKEEQETLPPAELLAQYQARWHTLAAEIDHTLALIASSLGLEEGKDLGGDADHTEGEGDV